MMKYLIWGLCLLICTTVLVAIRQAGVMLGGIPTVILYVILLYLPAHFLCKRWEERQETKKAIQEIRETTDNKTEKE